MEDFDYRLRPAKNIERKMLAEAFSRLFLFGKPSDYQYVGFGAIWFNDFLLFHKSIGFANMISIEKEESKESRYKFNCPLDCIDMLFGDSSLVLPDLTWERKSVVWLDYTDLLTQEILDEISLVISQLPSGSFLIISINVEPSNYRIKIENGADKPEYRTKLESLTERFGREQLPDDLKETDIKEWKVADICRDIFINRIEETLNQKNGVFSEDEKFTYKPTFNFRYKDGVRMATFGGLVVQNKDLKIFDKCAFEQFDYYRSDNEGYIIKPPMLTFREIHAFEKIIHSDPLNTEGIPNVIISKIEDFRRLHRYFPAFVVTEI
jgi:hypothetical protein